MKKTSPEETLKQLHKILHNEGGCAAIIQCVQCPLFYYRKERALNTMNCTSNGNLETALQIIRELEATELMNML